MKTTKTSWTTKRSLLAAAMTLFMVGGAGCSLLLDFDRTKIQDGADGGPTDSGGGTDTGTDTGSDTGTPSDGGDSGSDASDAAPSDGGSDASDAADANDDGG